MSAPKPKWFISRGAGTYTALIPVDELPYTIQLQGVPRAMTADQVIGLNFVAETGPAQQRFLLERQPQLTGHGLLESPSAVRSAKQFFAPDAFVKEIKILSEEATSRAETSTDTEDCQYTIEPASRPDSAAALRTEIYSPIPRPLPPSGCEPDETKKVYCSYWMHHGSCDYTQQGCKYKHEMPTDRQTLLKLGFRSTPKWFLEEQAAARTLRLNASSNEGKMLLPGKNKGTAFTRSEQRQHSTKSIALGREAPNVKRPRFGDISNTSGSNTGRAPQSPKPKLLPPVVANSRSKTGLFVSPTATNSAGSARDSSPATQSLAATPSNLRSIIGSLDLIDLSDSDMGSNEFVTAMQSRPGASHASPQSSEDSSPSDSDVTAEPRTPSTPASTLTTPVRPRSKGVFIPSGESPTKELRPQTYAGKRTFRKQTPRPETLRRKTETGPAAATGRLATPDSRAKGLDTSIHASATPAQKTDS